MDKDPVDELLCSAMGVIGEVLKYAAELDAKCQGLLQEKAARGDKVVLQKVAQFDRGLLDDFIARLADGGYIADSPQRRAKEAAYLAADPNHLLKLAAEVLTNSANATQNGEGVEKEAAAETGAPGCDPYWEQEGWGEIARTGRA